MKPKELFIGALVLHEDQLCMVEHIEKAGLIYCQICGTEKRPYGTNRETACLKVLTPGAFITGQIRKTL